MTDPYRTSAEQKAEDLFEATLPKPLHRVAELPRFNPLKGCRKCGHEDLRVKYWPAFESPELGLWALFVRQKIAEIKPSGKSFIKILHGYCAENMRRREETWFDEDALEVACKRCGYELGFFQCLDFKDLK